MAGTAAYSHALTFHPNGLVHRFKYGNGVAFSQTLDNMQRPMDLLNAKAGCNRPRTLRVGSCFLPFKLKEAKRRLVPVTAQFLIVQCNRPISQIIYHTIR